MRLLAFLLLLTACQSSTGLVDEGFTLTPREDGSFLARFHSPRPMSEENLRRNLTWHAARAAIDRGFVWLTVDGVDVDRSLKTESASREGNRMESASSAEPGATTAPTLQPSYEAAISISRNSEATAVLTFFRDKPSTATALEASKLLDEVGP